MSISKYIEESAALGRDDTLYFPTEFFQWMQVGDRVFKLGKLKVRALPVAVPVFMTNHCKLNYVNLAGDLLHLNDGVTLLVPLADILCVKEVLDLILDLCPHHLFLQT